MKINKRIEVTIDNRINALRAADEQRIANNEQAQNASSIRKLVALRAELLKESAFFADYKIDVQALSTLAIYAMQKVAAIAYSVNVKRDLLDQHTRALFRNQRATAHYLTNQQCNASLSLNCDADSAEALTQRNRVHTTTATTQASSSRQALAFIRCASLEKHAVSFDAESDVYKALDAIIAA